MNWDQVNPNWASICGEVKSKWGKFTDEDLLTISGERESFVRLFARRYGGDQEAAGATLDAFVQGLEARPNKKGPASWPQRCWKKIRSFIHVRHFRRN